MFTYTMEQMPEFIEHLKTLPLAAQFRHYAKIINHDAEYARQEEIINKYFDQSKPAYGYSCEIIGDNLAIIRERRRQEYYYYAVDLKHNRFSYLCWPTFEEALLYGLACFWGTESSELTSYIKKMLEVKE